MMLLTDTLDIREYAMDIAGVSKKYTYSLEYDRTVVIMGRSAI